MSKIFDTVKTILDKIWEEATFFMFWLKETFNQVKFINTIIIKWSEHKQLPGASRSGRSQWEEA